MPSALLAEPQTEDGFTIETGVRQDFMKRLRMHKTVVQTAVKVFEERYLEYYITHPNKRMNEMAANLACWHAGVHDNDYN